MAAACVVQEENASEIVNPEELGLTEEIKSIAVTSQTAGQPTETIQIQTIQIVQSHLNELIKPQLDRQTVPQIIQGNTISCPQILTVQNVAEAPQIGNQTIQLQSDGSIKQHHEHAVVVTNQVTQLDGSIKQRHEHAVVVTNQVAQSVDTNQKVRTEESPNEYDSDRRSGRVPARRRTIPFKFRDYKNPDAVNENNSSDEDFTPDQDVIPAKRPAYTPSGRGRRGRPRKVFPQFYTTNTSPQNVSEMKENSTIQLVQIREDGEIVETPAKEGGQQLVLPSGDHSTNQGVVTTPKPTDTGDNGKPGVKVTGYLVNSTGRSRGRPAQDAKCLECGKLFSSKGNLKVHMLLHSGEKPFPCDFQNCNKTFRSNETLRRHRLSHMGIKSFECSFCSKMFASSVSLQEHMCRHTDSRPHQCNICLKNFRQISCLRRHLVTHSSELPFSCQVCGKKFSLMVYLRSHMKVHTGERPHKCDKCDKTFAHQSDLTRHKIIHTGDRPYECGVCHSRFSDPSSKRRHQREHVGVKPYTCQLCCDSFKRAGQLKAHLSRKHTNEKEEVHMIRSENGAVEFIFKDGSNQLVKEMEKEGSTVDKNSLSKQKKIVKLIKELNSSMVQHVQINLPSQEYSGVEGQTASEGAVQTVYLETMETEQQKVQQSESSIAEAVIHDLVSTNSEVQEVTDIQNIVTSKANDEGEQTVITIAEVPDFMQAAENGEVPVEYLQIIEELAPDSIEQQIVEVHYQQPEDAAEIDTQDLLKNGTSNTDLPALDKSLPLSETSMETDNHIEGQQEVISSQEETSSPTQPPSSPTNNQSPTANPDFVSNPDFNSQQYYNWLSSFTELCKVVPMPLDVSLFQKISQVHKTLSDVMATPVGVVADKENFKILMNISKELNAIINEHLLYVMQNLDGESDK